MVAMLTEKKYISMNYHNVSVWDEKIKFEEMLYNLEDKESSYQRSTYGLYTSKFIVMKYIRQKYQNTRRNEHTYNSCRKIYHIFFRN